MITKEYLQQELAKRIDGYKCGVETTTDNIIAEMKSILVLVDGLEDNKYNDALKRAEVAYKDTDKHIKATIERIFPELRESEDERNWKVVLEYIKDDSLRSWLEKQKESLGGTFSSYEMAKTFTDGQNYVMKHPEKFGLQKLAEWSDEDEKHINLILRVLDIQQCWDGATGKKFNPYQGEIDWLKSLRPQPRWKPSDEQMNCLCAAVDAAIRKHNESVSGYRPARVLKSLYEDLKKLI